MGHHRRGTLALLQDVVGGFVVPLHPTITMWVNDTGLMDAQPINRRGRRRRHHPPPRRPPDHRALLRAAHLITHHTHP